MGQRPGLDQGMKPALQLNPFQGIHLAAHIDIGGIGIIDLSGGDVAFDHRPGVGSMVFQVQAGKTVGRALRRGLFQDKMHVVPAAQLFGQDFHLGNNFQAELVGRPGLVHLLAQVNLHQLVQPHHANQIGNP